MKRVWLASSQVWPAELHESSLAETQEAPLRWSVSHAEGQEIREALCVLEGVQEKNTEAHPARPRAPRLAELTSDPPHEGNDSESCSGKVGARWRCAEGTGLN